jgi:hypothetical protein
MNAECKMKKGRGQKMERGEGGRRAVDRSQAAVGKWRMMNAECKMKSGKDSRRSGD